MNIFKLQTNLTKFILPIANKIESQKHLQSIKDGITSIIPIIILGSICILPIAIANLFGSGTIYDFIMNNLGILTYADKFTNGLLSVYAAFFIAESLSKKYGINNTQIGINAIVVHFILSGVIIEGGINNQYLGAEGLFTSMISAILTVEITRFMINKKMVIKLPESVPTMVGESFISLFPIIVTCAFATIMVAITKSTVDKVFPEFLMGLLSPALKSMDTLPALITVIFFTQFLWFFGIHGPAITSAVWAPFAIQYAAENIAAYAAGEQVTHIFTFGLYYNVLQVTGSGLTLGLVILMIRSRAKSLSAVGKVAIIPSLFGINEPVIFGVPIMLNPFMFIPFVFGPIIITVITYFVMKLGVVGMPIANPPGFLPPGVGVFLMTLDWKAVVLVFINLIVMALIYYPFFKAMESEELRKEQVVNNI